LLLHSAFQPVVAVVGTLTDHGHSAETDQLVEDDLDDGGADVSMLAMFAVGRTL